MKKFVRRPSPAMVVALLALIVAASGTAVAASKLKSGDKLIKKGSLSGNRLKNNSVTGGKINLSTLGKVPSAATADNANSLGGAPASAYFGGASVHRSGLITINAGTSNSPVFTNNPLSETFSCIKSGVVLTASFNVSSTVAGWLWDASYQAAAGTQNLDNADDTGSPGSPSTTTAADYAVAPGGQSLQGLDTIAVNYPSAGKCSLDANAIS